MYWYRQFPGQSLVLMATVNQGSEATYESGLTKDKFPILCPNLPFSTLTVSNVSPEGSSSYFCSAGDTCWAQIKGPSKNPCNLLPGSIQVSLRTLGSRLEGGNHSSWANAAPCVLVGGDGCEWSGWDGEKIGRIRWRAPSTDSKSSYWRLRIKFLPEECLKIFSKDNQIQLAFKWYTQKYALSILSQVYI